MKNKFSYVVYGLTILSEIECSELSILEVRDDSSYDVIIELGSVSSKIHEKILEGIYSNFTNESMWFYVEGVATYWIKNGNTVTIELCEGADIPMAKQYLLGSCLGMIMLQRNVIAIHGGAIVFQGEGVIFTGHCGAGKSTITSALRLKGYRFIADDVSSINSLEAHYVNPGFPQQKLCGDAMIHFGYEELKYKSLMGDNQIKYLIPAHESFVSHPVPLKAVVELIPSDDVDTIEIEVLTGQDKFMVIYNNIYRIEIKRLAGVDPQYFRKCIEIAKDVPVYRLKRPKNQMTVEEQINSLEKLFITNLEA